MFQKIEQQLRILLKEAAESYISGLPVTVQSVSVNPSVDIPKEKEFGHLSSNIALKLAGPLRRKPQDIASEIASRLKKLSGSANLIKDAQVKGAGFINIFLDNKVFFELLKEANDKEDDFGRSSIRKQEKTLVEFVSANPTGPLSVAHARQAAVGDALANILSFSGYDVTKEYYLNDEGNQINILGRSIDYRYRQLQGEKIDFPEDHYQGQYIIDLAKELLDNKAISTKISKFGKEERAKFFLDYGVDKILQMIKGELNDFGVIFDVWCSQKSLSASGRIEKTLNFLKSKGYIYESEGAVWFKSTEFGDDKDRVVKKSDGSYTYLAPDIAYHKHKFERGFKKLINLWGPDHHGYIPRMQAAVAAMGESKDALSVIIVQLATLFRAGQPVPMSTRKGQYVTLTEVLTEVGRDASRFFFLMRKTDSHLDFDLELAKKQTSENPVYYVQYAHARISSILASAKDAASEMKNCDFSLLKEPEEMDLMKSIFEFGYYLQVCANQLDPYPLTNYLQSLAASFHRFYDKHKVLSSDQAMTKARLMLVRAAKIVLSNGLKLLGVSAPEHM